MMPSTISRSLAPMVSRPSDHRKPKEMNSPTFTSIPNGLKVGKRIFSNKVFIEPPQIFLECAGQEPDCHDSIALIPKTTNAHAVIEATTDVQAGKIFAAYGWLVMAFNNERYSRCPVCRKKVTVATSP